MTSVFTGKIRVQTIMTLVTLLLAGVAAAGALISARLLQHALTAIDSG